MERIRKESGAAVMVTLQQEYYYKYLLKVRMIIHQHHHYHQSHPNGNTVRKLIEAVLMNALNINLLSIIYND